MRIVHVTPTLGKSAKYGGPPATVAALCEALYRTGAHLKVLSTSALPITETSYSYCCEVLRPWVAPDITPLFWLPAMKLAKWADVVHVTGVFSAPSLQGLIAAHVLGTPVVLSTRGVLSRAALSQGRIRAKKAVIRLVSRLRTSVACVHATTKEEAEDVRRIWPWARVAVIPNGADLPKQVPPMPKAPVVGWLGRIHPIKNLELLIDAMAELHDCRPNTVLRIAGPIEDQRYFERLRAQVMQRGLGQCVQFIGAVDPERRSEYLQEIAVLALTSHSENFGNVVLEALAHGRPVVVTENLPWGHLRDEGVGLVSEADPSAVARALSEAISSPWQDREQQGRMIAFVQGRYGWERIAARMLEVYAEAIAEHRTER